MKLDIAHLGGLAGVRTPDYEPRKVGIGIVHLGLGNFHRAHQAVYTDDVLARDRSWGICGVSLRSRGVVDALAAQDGLYTLLVRDADGASPRVIGSVREALCGSDGMPAVIARIAAPRTRIVSLTVTEKGYCHDPAGGRLDAAHPDIAHDIANSGAPVSAPGVLLAGIAARMGHGTPLTVLCCDNLPHNGATARRILLDLADLTDASLARWIEKNVAFPSTMVDRIVPATTADDVAAARGRGVDDAAPVATEAFTQWVIEDRFADARPAWEAAGAQMVSDVAPFELTKLRLVNGAHSAIAYLGHLAGYAFVHQAVADPAIAGALRRLWDELAPTLPATPGIDPATYTSALMRRFGNAALKHRTWQIAMDGSQKLPQRLLAAARERLACRQGVDAIALAVAAWMRYVAGRDDRGDAIDVRDPLAGRFADARSRAAGSADALCDELLALRPVFGDDLGADPRFAGPVRSWLARLTGMGVLAALA